MNGQRIAELKTAQMKSDRAGLAHRKCSLRVEYSQEDDLSQKKVAGLIRFREQRRVRRSRHSLLSANARIGLGTGWTGCGIVKE